MLYSKVYAVVETFSSCVLAALSLLFWLVSSVSFGPPVLFAKIELMLIVVSLFSAFSCLKRSWVILQITDSRCLSWCLNVFALKRMSVPRMTELFVIVLATWTLCCFVLDSNSKERCSCLVFFTLIYVWCFVVNVYFS